MAAGFLFIILNLLLTVLSVVIHVAVCFYCYKKQRYRPQTGGNQNQVPIYEEDVGGNGSGSTYDVIINLNNETRLTPPEMKQNEAYGKGISGSK